MKISDNGVEFIKSWEKFKPEPYDDGYGFPTIGFGHKILKAEKFSGPITEGQADTIFRWDLLPTERAVNKAVKVEVTQNQYDALVSLTFNIGSGNFLKSTLLIKLNAGDIQGAAMEFRRWRKSNGQIVEGLEKRRYQEIEVFLNENYQYTH